MTRTVKYPIVLSATFLWLGFVLAISFMEAWLKFRAPGITLPLGLGIGRLVFSALNKVEWFFVVIIIGSVVFAKTRDLSVFLKPTFLLAFEVLFLETVWALPALDARAEVIIQGDIPPASNLHFFYIGMEFLKVVCLFIFGIRLFEKG